MLTTTRARGVTTATMCGALALAACTAGGLSSNKGPPVPAATPAASARTCPACNVDPTRYLRQLSLDLRGRPPSFDELDALRMVGGDVTPEIVDGMLHSDDFLGQVKSWHKALLWPTLDGFKIHGGTLVASDYDDKTGAKKGGVFSPDPALVSTDPKQQPPHGFVFFGDGNIERFLRGTQGAVGCDPLVEYPAPASPHVPQPTYATTGSDGQARHYPYYDADGVPLPLHDAAHCPNYCTSATDAERTARDFKPKPPMYSAMNAPGADAKPQELDPKGMHCPATHPFRIVNRCDNAFAANDPENLFRQRREGYRPAKHYWTKGLAVKTCAYEAQDRETSATTGQSCAGQTLRDPSCGCGPNGVYCMPAVAFNSPIASRAEFLVRSALDDEPLQIVASVVERDEDYFAIFTTRRSFITGPLAFLYERQLGSIQGLELAPPAAPEAMPSIAYDDATWHEYVRDAEHSGVLTTPAYLGRFPTWRSRVSQFRSAFMCRPFTPGTASLPASDDPCTREPNLAQRCGCKNCHSAIEPMSAWFGRWSERSSKYLDAATFPAFDPYCQQCALTKQGCTPRCTQEYVTKTVDAESARYAGTLRGYLYRSPMEEARIDEGPAGLVESALASGELEACTVKTTWARLVGRPMSDDELSLVLPWLVIAFDESHHSYRALVRTIVTSPAYRRLD